MRRFDPGRSYAAGTARLAATLLACGWYLFQCPGATAQTPPQGVFNLALTLSDEAQSTTLGFDGLAVMTGNLDAQSFFPPGKVADYTGFQYLRDNDPDNMGHDTSFLTRIANNVIYILTPGQMTQLVTLASAQLPQVNLYGYQRYALMEAFRRLTDGTVPSGTTGLSLAAVKQASHNLYLIDGQIAFDRAMLYASIYSSMTSAQINYLAAMKGKGFNSWPNITGDQIASKMNNLPLGTATLVMTYASDIFSWYAGSLDADVYFCPERHGTYYGGFYIKDAPAVGVDGYNISEQLTNTAGSALSDSSLGYVTADQATWMTALVDAQRNNLYAGTTNIVETRTQIATLLRSLLVSTASSASVNAQVLALSGTYGDLDGEDNFLYATVFAHVYSTLSASQKTQLAALRKSVLTGTYADGTTFDFTNCTTPFLYSDVIPDPSVLQPYISNTDYMFQVDSPLIATFIATPSTVTAGQAATLSWDVAGASAIGIDNGVGTVSTVTSKSVTPAATTTYTLTATNSAGSVTAQATVAVATCTLASAPTSFAVTAGGSSSATIACGAVQNGFNTPLTVTVSGAPTGVTASAAPATIVPGTGQATLTLTAAGTAAAGSYTLTVRATAGTFTQSLSLSLTVNPAPAFTLTLAAASVSVLQGASGQVKIATAHIGSFNSAIALSATGAPSGVTASFSPSTIAAPGDGTSTLTVGAASSAAAGTYTLTVQGVGGGVTRTQTLTVSVQPAPGFALSASPNALTVTQGLTGTATVSISGLAGGFNSIVALSVASSTGSGLPAGLTATFTPKSVPAPGSGASALALTPSASMAPGTYPLTITASGGSVTRTATLSLTVATAPSITLSTAASSISLLVGGAASVQIGAKATGGFQAPVALSPGTLPAGVTVNFAPATIASNGGSGTINVQTTSAAASGVYTITVTGTATGAAPASTSFTLNICKLTVTPSAAAVTVARNSSGAVTVNTAVSGTYSSSVALSVTGLPAGVAAAFSPATIAPPGAGASTLKFTVPSTAVPGAQNITVQASSGGVIQTATVRLTVQ
jgi:uncharacterized membrane protein